MSPRGEGVLEPELGGLREDLGSRWEGGAASAAGTVRAGFPRQIDNSSLSLTQH